MRRTGKLQAMALARAGVGRLTIIDRDYVDTSNLQRQFLFEESDAAEALPSRGRRAPSAPHDSTVEIRASSPI